MGAGCGKDGGRNPWADSVEGEERKGDDVCSLLEIHEIEKVGDLKKRINQTYLSTSMNICKYFYV